MVEVVAGLGAAGVDALVLKGPVTARWLYDSGEVRAYSDCDLLAAPDRFVTAGRVLQAAGFHLHEDGATHPEAWGEGRAQSWHRLPEDVWVDLHWRLPGVGAAPEEAWEILWTGREQMEVGGANVFITAEPARAMHLATGAAANSEARKPQLDLERGIGRLPETTWRAAAELAARLNAVPAFADGLRLAPGGAELARRLSIPRRD
jgi:hypothetical protein